MLSSMEKVGLQRAFGRGQRDKGGVLTPFRGTVDAVIEYWTKLFKPFYTRATLHNADGSSCQAPLEQSLLVGCPDGGKHPVLKEKKNVLTANQKRSLTLLLKTKQVVWDNASSHSPVRTGTTQKVSFFHRYFQEDLKMSGVIFLPPRRTQKNPAELLCVCKTLCSKELS